MWLVLLFVRTVTACHVVEGGPVDQDGDGFDTRRDCDDADPSIHPFATEACNGRDDDCDGDFDEDVRDAPFWHPDADGDGAGAPEDRVQACAGPEGWVSDARDCDDADSMVSPSATEVCDGVDNDCDGLVDGDDTGAEPGTWYPDADQDGYGNEDAAFLACSPPEGSVTVGGDCDDSDPQFNPGAVEACEDPRDLNCDGVSPRVDADRDGWAACEECDDTNASVNPNADELCDTIDNDCDGETDEDTATNAAIWHTDADGDGYGAPGSSVFGCVAPAGTVADASDCDDAAPGTNPGAAEACETTLTDEDCDGLVNDNDPSVTGTSAWHPDADRDGYGDVSANYRCTAGFGELADGTDCDDAAHGTHPGAVEHCDDVDEDCDGSVDDAALDAATWYADSDGDGFGDPSVTLSACDAPAAYAANPLDCDDTNAAASPRGVEVCDGVDNDCDGTTDVGATDAPDWYADADGDGYGDAAYSRPGCAAPAGFLADATDCDDGDSAIHPGATELCNGADDDCEGSADGDDAADVATWYADADGDGHGDPSASDIGCSQPAGYVANTTDCDDSRADVNPDEVEVCDPADVDEDCDGAADDSSALGQRSWYADADLDGYGDETDAGVSACESPAGVVAGATDCDDADASVHPGATEACNGQDDDCDGTSDPGTAGDAVAWYLDADGDGFGDASVSTESCAEPSGYTADWTDCDDADFDAHPGAAEYCDGDDDDCDGAVDEDASSDVSTWYRDDDGDGHGVATDTLVTCYEPTGYAAISDDCDDTHAGISPDETEICDTFAVDEDCNGLADDLDPGVSSGTQSTVYADADGDGYGVEPAELYCVAPSGYVSLGTDCDDADAAVSPGEVETCENGVDDDCDGADTCRWQGEGDLADADSAFVGAATNDYLGASIAAADLDRDGEADLIIGAYGTDYSTASQNTGTAYIWHGPISGESLATYDTSITGEGPGDRLGWSQAFLGDTDYDGMDEILLGADGYDDGSVADAGAAYLFESPEGALTASDADATIVGDARNDFVSWALGTGDFDGDGRADVAVSAFKDDHAGGTDAGSVGVFYGPISGSSSYSAADLLLEGDASADYFGSSVVGVDIDGDGLDDLVVGADGADPGGASAAGSVYVFTALAGTLLTASDADSTLDGAAAGDKLGSTVVSANDADDDGYRDLYVAAYEYTDGSVVDAGAVFLVLGSSTGVSSGTVTSVRSASFIGAAASDRAGTSVAEGADIDRDGDIDILVGAPDANAGGLSNSGRVYLSYGPFSGTMSLDDADGTWGGVAAGDQLGSAVATLGDINHDRLRDFAFGAYTQDDGSTNGAGGAYVFFGTAE